jgi:rhodanese-related sulfurtransferase
MNPTSESTSSRRLVPIAAGLVLTALALLGCALLGPSDEELSAIQSSLDDALLVDVRSPEEFADGYLEGAVNIPVGELEGRLQELEPRERPVIVYCRSGFRSSSAADTLRDAGFRSVMDLGGIGNGEDVGLKTVNGAR